MEDEVPVFRPLLGAEERAACDSVLDVGWLGMGSFVSAFESELDRMLELEDDRRVVAVSTGHAALHLSLLLAGVGPGDEVITPSLNNVADLQAIAACGGEPVFCDVRDEDLCADPDSIAGLIGPRTRAIIVTDYFCHVADRTVVQQIAEQAGVRVVHDAAHSFGSTVDGQPVGSDSDVAVFSFDPVKTITCIDGGAVVAAREDVARLHEMRLIGMSQPVTTMYRNQRAWTYDVRAVGYRYHLANLHAAIGLAQLKKLSRIITSRWELAQTYTEAFASASRIRTPGGLCDGVVPFSYYVRVPASERTRFREHLRDRGVDTGIHWTPGHQFSLFATCRRGDLDVTQRASEEIVTVPFHSEMNRSHRDRVIDGILSYR